MRACFTEEHEHDGEEEVNDTRAGDDRLCRVKGGGMVSNSRLPADCRLLTFADGR